MAKLKIRTSDKHLRAICAEIGYRLRQCLDTTAQAPSARLAAVLRRLEELEQLEAPSIVPSLEGADGGLQTEYCRPNIGL